MIHLEPHAAKLAPVNPLGLEPPPLYHQMRTYDALRDHALVVNTYDTGTGKTIGALLGLLDPARRGANCLLIAPTNELIRQHAADAQGFVSEYHLEYHVLPVDAAWLRALPAPDGREGERAGEKLKRLFDNPRDYGWDGRKPLLVVTNPDIFYYALFYSAYNPHDQRNLFEQFLTRFDYVIVDEFHYYSPKQLACFLFFFIICREWGYFDQGRRVCLLSATPDSRVEAYLRRVFPDEAYIAWLNPANEPPESRDYATTPTLAPLDLEVRTGTVDEFIGDTREQASLANWLDTGQDGAVISSALWRINQAYASLRRPGFADRVSRLTGAESSESRRSAPLAPLILATPTVDIGYNFGKPGKRRQPIDFLVFDARTRDEFIQRLGRAGRVLGRSETACLSHATALLEEDAAAALRVLDGQTLTRAHFRRLVAETLPPRYDLYAYVRSYAVFEAFRPIFRLTGQVRPDLQEWLERLFDAVRTVFDPDGKSQRYESLQNQMRRHDRLTRIVRQKELDGLSSFVDDYLNWLSEAEFSLDEIESVARMLRQSAAAQSQLMLRWAEAEYWKTEALFNFRDAFEGPTAVVYDPNHLLADADVSIYDALHIVANFEVEALASAKDFQQACGVEPGKADLYGRLRSQREPSQRLRLAFEYREPRMSRETWEKLFTRRPVALAGLHLRADMPGAGPVPLPTPLRQALENAYVVCLVVPPAEQGRVRLLLRNRNIFSRTLHVTFLDEPSPIQYLVLVGTAAFIVHAELQGYLYYRTQRASQKAVII